MDLRAEFHGLFRHTPFNLFGGKTFFQKVMADRPSIQKAVRTGGKGPLSFSFQELASHFQEKRLRKDAEKCVEALWKDKISESWSGTPGSMGRHAVDFLGLWEGVRSALDHPDAG